MCVCVLPVRYVQEHVCVCLLKYAVRISIACVVVAMCICYVSK